MRILLTAFICLLLFACSGPAIDTPEAFGKSAATAISENDFETFQSLLVTDSDLDYIIANTQFATDADRQEVIAEKTEHFKKVLGAAKSSFDYFELFGTQFTSVEYTVQKEGKLEFIRNYTLMLTLNGSPVKVVFDGLVKTPDGWKSTGGYVAEFSDGPKVIPG